jgi:endonuclease-3
MKTSSSGEIVNRLKEKYPYENTCRDPFKVLISTILSQRTKDENTHKASAALFEQFDTPEALAHADIADIETLIYPSGFYRVKARRIQKVSRQILEKYKGEVPSNLKELLSLTGVGRKTANCVLVYGFGIPAIPVDVHVHRVANRLGLVSAKTPEKTEHQLMGVVPPTEWIAVNKMLVTFGKTVCRPRNPLCKECFLSDVCLSQE